MDGSQPAGEAEALEFLSLVPEAPSAEKSMQLINYVGGPNTECAGNSLFPVFVGSLRGRVTGDIKVQFNAASTAGAVDVRIWPDVYGQLCNEAYLPPARSVRVNLPAGPGLVEAVLSGASFDVGDQVMVQITPVVETPFVGRMFYGTPDARVEFECIPSIGKTGCLP
jgi:hypothetical protein